MAVVTTNLEAWYDSTNSASNTGSGTTLYDLSGNSRNATVNNPTRVGNYFELTSTTTNVSIDTGSNFSSFMSGSSCQFSIEMWMWIESAAANNTNNYRYYVTNTATFAGGFVFAGERPTSSSGSQANIGMYFITPYYQWNPGNLTSGSWVQYTFVNDGAARRIYQNGTLQFSTTLGSSAIAAGDINLTFGGLTEGKYGWDGRFAIGRVYSKALTVGEIQQNYDADRFNLNKITEFDFSNTTTYSGSGSTVYDLTSYNNYGLINGATFGGSGTTKYFEFTGGNDNIYSPVALLPNASTSTWTENIWFQAESGSDKIIYCYGTTPPTSNSGTTILAYGFSGIYSGRVFYEAGSGADRIDLGFTPTPSTWYNVVLTGSGSTVSAYLNASLVGTVAQTQNILIPKYMNLSGLSNGTAAPSGYMFDGKIGVFRVYNIAQTSGQISAQFAEDNARFNPSPPPSLVASFDFGDPASYSGSGLTVYDLTVNNNDLVFTNAPTYNSALGGYVELNSTMSANIGGTFPNNLPFGQSDFSMIIWAQVPSTYNVGMFALGGGSPAGARVDMGYGFSPSVLGSEFYNSGIRQDTSPAPGTWFQYVITGVAGNATTQLLTYVNGSLDTITAVTSAPVIDFNNSGLFPADNPRLSINWQGASGDMKIIKAEVYDYAISAGDVTTDYAALQARISPPPTPYIGQVGGRTFGQGFAG